MEHQTEYQHLTYGELRIKLTRDLNVLINGYAKQLVSSSEKSGVIYTKLTTFVAQETEIKHSLNDKFTPTIMGTDLDPVAVREQLLQLVGPGKKVADGWFAGNHEFVNELQKILVDLISVKDLSHKKEAYKQAQAALEAGKKLDEQAKAVPQPAPTPAASSPAPATISQADIANLMGTLNGLQSSMQTMQKQMDKVNKGNEVVAGFLVGMFQKTEMRQAAIQSNLGGELTSEQMEYLPQEVVGALVPVSANSAKPYSGNSYALQGVTTAAQAVSTTTANQKLNLFVLQAYTAEGVADQEPGRAFAFEEKGKLINRANTLWSQFKGNATIQKDALDLICHLLVLKNAVSIFNIKAKLANSLDPAVLSLFDGVEDDAEIVASVAVKALCYNEAVGMSKLFTKNAGDSPAYFPYDPKSRQIFVDCYDKNKPSAWTDYYKTYFSDANVNNASAEAPVSSPVL